MYENSTLYSHFLFVLTRERNKFYIFAIKHNVNTNDRHLIHSDNCLSISS